MQPNLTDPSYLPHCQSIPLSSQQVEISVYQLLRPKALELSITDLFSFIPHNHLPAILINSYSIIDLDLSVSRRFHFCHSGPITTVDPWTTRDSGAHTLCAEGSASHSTVYFLCLWFHIHGFDQPLIMWYYSTDVLKTICMEEDSLPLLVFLLPLWQLLPPLIYLLFSLKCWLRSFSLSSCPYSQRQGHPAISSELSPSSRGSSSRIPQLEYEKEDIYWCITELLHCTAEINTTLWIYSTSINVFK